MQFLENEEAEGSFSSASSLDEGSSSGGLGLRLKKTPSLINLIQSKLTEVGQRKRMTDFRAQPIAEKMKASYFPLSLLIIGSWQRISKNEGDLTGKIYYAKRKLVWEILEGALKSKIEIQWFNISAISFHNPENGYGMLEIQLNEPPSFFRETNPQPKKHTNWQQAPDFTGGQASICRRHTVYFPPGKIEKEYEKLLQCDRRLFDLNNKPFPSHEYPYFHQNKYAVSDFPTDHFPGYLPEISHPQHNYPVHNFPHPNNFKQENDPHFTSTNPHSPMSDGGGQSYMYENQWGNEGVNNHIQGLQTIQGNAVQNYSFNYGEESSPVLDVNENHLLGDSSQHLFSDQPAFLSIYPQLDIQQAEANIIQDHDPQSICWFSPDHQVSNEGMNINSSMNTCMHQYVPPQQFSNEGMNVSSSRNMSMYQYALPHESTMEDFRQNGYKWN